MRQIRDILRLYWEQRLTMRQIAQSAGVGLASVSDRIHRAEAAGLIWPLAPDLDDLVLRALAKTDLLMLDDWGLATLARTRRENCWK